MLYRGGMRTPNAQQIEQITVQLSKYGKIEGKNVFYWFQNHKARERQKQKRNSLGLPHSPRTPTTTLVSMSPTFSTITTLDTPKRVCSYSNNIQLNLYIVVPKCRCRYLKILYIVDATIVLDHNLKPWTICIY